MRSFSNAILPDETSTTPDAVTPWGIILILVLGFAVRIFACQQTHVINPDGVYYIHQARAIYFDEWHSLTSCHLHFLSIYPFLIAGAYAIFHHWVFAANLVSVLFGTATLIPLYLLCRRFFERSVSALTLLVFALLPVFVARSSDVVRGPICWFFLALGLYYFIRSEERAHGVGLLFACLFFLIAAWARIESVLFILITAGYLLAAPSPRRFQNLAWFALPVVCALMIIFGTMLLFDKPLQQTLRLSEITTKLSAPIMAYEAIRAGLADLMAQQPVHQIMPHFLHKTRYMVWLVALGTLFKYMLRAYFYVFFIVFILGFGAVWQRLKQDRQMRYLAIMAGSVFLLLYLHVIQTWMMFDRFWTVFILPACVVMGFGLQKVMALLLSRCRLKYWAALSLMCFLILVCTLPKDLKSKGSDKVVYKKIGERIGEIEGNTRVINIAKSLYTPNWIPFYANLDYNGAPCPLGSSELKALTETGYEVFVKQLKAKKYHYLLWEENFWPRDAFDLLNTIDQKDFIKLGEWRHPDRGRMILYRIAS